VEATRSAGYLLMKAGIHASRLVEEALGSVALNAREYLVLTYLAEQPLSQQELSRRLGIDPTLVVGIVDVLEERELLARQRDPDDRRRYAVTLTAAGRKVLTKATKATAAAEDQLLAPLGAGEREELRGILLRVMQPLLPYLRSE
jgi:DNA-binding MarR family transcriptional regulator